jgi:hypothetical protein
MTEYVGYGAGGEGYGEIVRVAAPSGAAYWRLNRERSWLEDPLRGGNSGLHHIFVDAAPFSEGISAHIINHGTNATFHETLIHPPGSGHIASLEFPMWGMGNVYSLRLEGRPSDEVRGMLMPGNIHVSFHLLFELVDGHTAPTPSLRQTLLERAEQEQRIQFNPAAALQREIFRAGFVPNSPEFGVTFEGKRYLAQRAERLSNGAVRVYYGTIEQGQWRDGVRFEER